MIRRRWFLLSLLAVGALALPLPARPAAAQSLDELRAAGRIGERYDGYAVARDPALGDMVAEINAKRRGIYEQQAKTQGVAVDQVGQVYANQLIGKVPVGTWILTADGEWRRK